MAEKEKSLIVLKADWPGPFRRTVTIGKSTTQLVFNPGEPVEIDAKTARSLSRDIGQALRFCTVTSNGKIVLVEADPEPESNEPEATN